MTSWQGATVVDASVAMTWIRLEPASDWARALLIAGPLLAPPLFRAECANVLWRVKRRGEPGAPDPKAALDRLLALPIEHIDGSASATQAALALATRLDHPVYDCLYLALALDRDAALATADRRFAAAIQRAGALPPERLLIPPDAG